MKNQYISYRIAIMSAIAILMAFQSIAQDGQKALSLADYDGWKRIVGADISHNGQWVSYAYRPNDGNDTLYLKQVQTNQIHVLPNSSSADFSADGKWAAYMVDLPKAEREKLQKDRKPITRQAQLINLANGQKWTYENAAAIGFSPNSTYLTVRKAKASPDLKHKGTDLIIRNLASGMDQNFGNVLEFRFNEKESHLAYIVDADKAAGNGIYLLSLANSTVKPLDTDTLEYSNLTWNDQGFERPVALQKGTAIAVLKGNTPKEKVKMDNQLLVFDQLANATPRKTVYNTTQNPMSNNMVISERGSLSWSETDNVIYINLAEQLPEPPKTKDKLTNVEVWHWKDEIIQSVQKVRQNQLSNTTYRAAFHVVENKVVPLGSDDMRNVMTSRNPNFVVGGDPKPHIKDINWGISPADYYRIDTKTGAKQLIENEVGRAMGMSPDGNIFIYLKNEQVYAYHLPSNKKTHLTANTEVSFVNTDDDHPFEKPAYGIAGWSKDQKSIIINHKYDLYKVALDGSNVSNFTSNLGDKEEIQFRVLDLNPDERYLDLTKPLTLTAYGEWSKKAGFYQMQPGKAPQALVFTDNIYGRVSKARNANMLMYTRETFVDFPDYYISGLDFKNPTKVTDANPQQSEYGWGRRILVDYENSKGQKMQGTLALPAGYEEGKKYPMVVYFYEKMSQRHHQYSMPVYDDRPHMSTYASNGYLVFMPDVVYDEGTPGTNALDNVTSSVQKVIDLGYANPAKIGLQGHSWGGYQSSFIVTQTDMFACVVTGAPVTNLVSMYNILYKASGTVNHGIFELGQVRMGRDVTPWTHRDLYVSQSPIEHVDKIKTPFMILHGTADGAVDYNQGVELYNAARRMGKEVILLTYPDEPHHLGMLENQKDFQVRMKQYFDHYLKDAPAPKWMQEGMPFIKRQYDLLEN
jgi:dipeptidyl aminopeptidase/acylaminoacyl peptidase